MTKSAQHTPAPWDNMDKDCNHQSNRRPVMLNTQALKITSHDAIRCEECKRFIAKKKQTTEELRRENARITDGQIWTKNTSIRPRRRSRGATALGIIKRVLFGTFDTIESPYEKFGKHHFALVSLWAVAIYSGYLILRYAGIV